MHASPLKGLSVHMANCVSLSGIGGDYASCVLAEFAFSDELSSICQVRSEFLVVGTAAMHCTIGHDANGPAEASVSH